MLSRRTEIEKSRTLIGSGFLFANAESFPIFILNCELTRKF